ALKSIPPANRAMWANLNAQKEDACPRIGDERRSTVPTARIRVSATSENRSACQTALRDRRTLGDRRPHQPRRGGSRRDRGELLTEFAGLQAATPWTLCAANRGTGARASQVRAPGSPFSPPRPAVGPGPTDPAKSKPSRRVLHGPLEQPWFHHFGFTREVFAEERPRDDHQHHADQQPPDSHPDRQRDSEDRFGFHVDLVAVEGHRLDEHAE